MKRGIFSLVVLISSLYTLSCSAKSAITGQPRLPNIVFIMADDMGFGDPGCYNPQSKTKTSNIDTLAAQGMRFTDVHSPSSVCTPTRYSLLTGRYAWRSRLKKGVLQGYDPLLIEEGRMTVASLLKQRGYSTGCIGKWHLGFTRNEKVDYGKALTPGPNAVGFDYFFGIPSSLDFTPYVYVENKRVTAPVTGMIEASKHQRQGGRGFWRAGPIAPGFKHEEVLGVLTGKAIDFIERQSPDKPFFLYFPLASPHTPWLPTKPFKGKSGAGDYGDFVVETDAAIGRVLKALDDRKLSGNTLVIYTSDNGAHWLPDEIEKYEHRANGDWRGQKADIWEGGHRVPFIARWPGRIEPGTVSDELISLVDLMATVASIIKVDLPENAGEDSFNFLPVLLDQERTKPARESLIHHSIDGTFAIRKENWKLVLGLGSHGFSEPRVIEPEPGLPPGQLYDIKKDPREEHNLWLNEPETVVQLTALVEKIQRDGRTAPLNRKMAGR